MSEFVYRIEVYPQNINKNRNYFKMQTTSAKPIIDCIETGLKKIAGFEFGDVPSHLVRIMKINVRGHTTRQLFIYYSIQFRTNKIIVKDIEEKLKEVERNLIIQNQSSHSAFRKKLVHNHIPNHYKNNRQNPTIEQIIKPYVKLISNDVFWTELNELYNYVNYGFSERWKQFTLSQDGGRSIKKNTKKKLQSFSKD
jgi:hypothetical protein